MWGVLEIRLILEIKGECPSSPHLSNINAILLVMSMLSPRLQLRVQQKQILTPGLVQMVTVLQLNRLELKEMLAQEVAENPILEETQDGDDLTPSEIQTLLEAERVQEIGRAHV